MGLPVIWVGVGLGLLVLAAAVVFHALGLRGGFAQVADALRGLRGAVQENTEATRAAQVHAESAAAAGQAMHAVLRDAAKRTPSGRGPLPSYGSSDTIARETPLPIEGR